MLIGSSLVFPAGLACPLASGGTARPIDDVRAEEHYNRGVNFLKSGRAELAIAEFQMSVELRPKEMDTHLNLGNAFAANKQIPEAIKEWETCVQMDPTYPRAYFNLATTYRARQEYRKALEYYRTYMTLSEVGTQEAQKIKKIVAELREKLAKNP